MISVVLAAAFCGRRTFNSVMKYLSQMPGLVLRHSTATWCIAVSRRYQSASDTKWRVASRWRTSWSPILSWQRFYVRGFRATHSTNLPSVRPQDIQAWLPSTWRAAWRRPAPCSRSSVSSTWLAVLATSKALQRFRKCWHMCTISSFLRIMSRSLPIPVAKRSKARVSGPWLAETANLNPTGSWCSASWKCCVSTGRGLCDGPIPIPDSPTDCGLS